MNEGIGAFFHLFGGASLPEADLKVKWDGSSVGPYAVFTGNLATRSVDSDGPGAVGVICCGA